MMALLALPALLLLLLGTTELAMRAYYRAQVHSAATAAALAAVGDQSHWSIPVPTQWIVVPPGAPIPVDGFVVNLLRLPSVDTGPKNGVVQVRDLTNPNIKLDSDILPWPGWVPSPFKWVRITASVEPAGVFSKIFKAGPVRESACAIAWIRPDWWWHPWWDERTEHTLFRINDEPYHYYRLMPCDQWSAADILEAVAWAHLETTGEDKHSIIRENWGKSADNRKQNAENGPVSTGEVDQCRANPQSCRKQEPHTVGCWDGSSATIEARPWVPGEHVPTAGELATKYCPPKPPAKTAPEPAPYEEESR